MINLFLFSILLHIIDDFVLQPICLSKLKQKQWWIDECNKQKVDFNNYKNDYKCGLFIHSLSWSIMIMLPLLLTDTIKYPIIIIALVVLNCWIHYKTDNEKANKYEWNLCEDQIIHFLQIIGLYLSIYIINDHNI